MVMADERFGQLEAGEIADPGHPAHHAFGFEHRKVAVDAARTLARGPYDDLVDGEGLARFRKELDEVTAGAGVAAGAVGETGGDRLVQIQRHRLSITG